MSFDNKYRFKIGDISYSPKGDYKIKWEKEGEEVFYRKKFAGTLIFFDDNGEGIEDYSNLVEAMEGDCDRQVITIERKCDGEWSTYWEGYFTKFMCRFDDDRCELRVTPKPNDEYDCWLKNEEAEYDIFDITSSQTVTYSPFATFEYATCSGTEVFYTPISVNCSDSFEEAIKAFIGMSSGFWQRDCLTLPDTWRVQQQLFDEDN